MSRIDWNLPPAWFEEARLCGLQHLQSREGIGTLRERSLHAILKYWIDPDETHHEVKLPSGTVADLFDGEEVIEIQTRNFSKLRSKLAALLDQYPVTVVHPLTWHKTLRWIDPESGDSTPPRRSPKVGSFGDAARELVYIGELLSHPRLTVVLMLLDMEEWRVADGWSRDGKKGSHRLERFPLRPGPVTVLRQAIDYAVLLPNRLPEEFTVADVRHTGRFSAKQASSLVNVLYKVGSIKRIGKIRNAFVYRCTEEKS